MNVPMALAATALSVFVPSSSSNNKGGSSNSMVVSSSSAASMFLMGIVTGAGLYAYADAQIQRRRLKERARASYVAWLRHEQRPADDDDDAENKNNNDDNAVDAGAASRLYTPCPAEHLRSRPLSPNNTDDGLDEATLRILASPRTTLTSSLYAGMIVLPRGSRMRPRESKGVELYYVLRGSGLLMRDGEESKSGGGFKVGTGDVFVVNPWSVRWLANKEREHFMFLRITDAGHDYCNEENYDVVVKYEIPSSVSAAAIDLVKRGLTNTYNSVWSTVVAPNKESGSTTDNNNSAVS